MFHMSRVRHFRKFDQTKISEKSSTKTSQVEAGNTAATYESRALKSFQ